MPAKRLDRRVVRTRELVLEAFRTLMIERGYERMTVQHVLDRAGIGRTTFYEHFTSKDDLLRASVGRLQSGLRAAWREQARRSRGDPKPLGFSLGFLQHIDSHRRIYDMILGKPSEVTVDRHMRRMLEELAREDLMRRPHSQGDLQKLEVAAQFVSGALWSLILWWLSTRARLTPEELDTAFRQLVLEGTDGTFGRA